MKNSDKDAKPHKSKGTAAPKKEATVWLVQVRHIATEDAAERLQRVLNILLRSTFENADPDQQWTTSDIENKRQRDENLP